MQKKLKIAHDIFKDNSISSKIYIYLAYQTAGDDYDPYEKRMVKANLNPIVIKGYVRDINPEALVWKQYGLANIGAKEILCDTKYDSYFRKCEKIVIDNEKYQVFHEGTGNKAIIQKRPFQMMRVVVSRMN